MAERTGLLQRECVNNINTYIKHNPNYLYISTTSGEPVINELLIVSERYCFYVIKNHHQWFIMASNVYGLVYTMPVQELKDKLNMAQSLSDALKTAYDYFVCADKADNRLFYNAA